MTASGRTRSMLAVRDMKDRVFRESQTLCEEGCALVLYESPAAREQAIRFCEQMNCQEDGGLNAQWYSFEDLKTPSTRTDALNKAAEAEMVVFAISAIGDFPAEVKFWMENWIGKRGEREGMLVGLVLDETSNTRDIACLKEVYLRHVAHRAGMDYLSHMPARIFRAMPDLLDSFAQRKEQVTSVLDEILQTGFVPPHMPLR